MIDPQKLQPGDVVLVNDRLGEILAIDSAGNVTVATMIETASYASEWFAEIASPVTAGQLRRVRLLPRHDDGIRGFTREEAIAAATGGAGSVLWAHEHASRRPAFRMSHADAIRNEGRVRDHYTGRDDLEEIARKHAAEDVAVATAGVLERVAAVLGVTVEELAEDASVAVRDRDAARAALAKVAEIAFHMHEEVDGERADRDRPKGGQSCGPRGGPLANATPSVLSGVSWWARAIDEAIRAVPAIRRKGDR